MPRAGIGAQPTARVFDAAQRAKYAAGWDWPAHPDVFHDAELRRKYYAMWAFVAARYRSWGRVAGYEIMSEPRTKVVPQQQARGGCPATRGTERTPPRDHRARERPRDLAHHLLHAHQRHQRHPRQVMAFMRGGCDVLRAEDPRALCVVGPAPYYKAWELTDAVLLPSTPNVLYTFDFFVPWKFVASDSAKDAAAFPGSYPCNQARDCPGPPPSRRRHSCRHPRPRRALL